MSILSDRQIRARCTPPTHTLQIDSLGNRALVYYDECRREVVDVRDGHAFPGFKREMLEANPAVRRIGLGNMVEWQPMIEPFEPNQVRQRAVRTAADEGYLERVISYGTSSYGYDVRCGRKFKVFTNINSTVVDPKNFDEKSFVEVEGDHCIIPPNSFALANTMEYFRIPRDVLTVCLGKSTYARCGIIVNVTPFEPEWEGYVTLEFSNTTPLPAKIYAGEGCAQVLFFRGDEPCETSYKDRSGKYMGQAAEPVVPKL